MEERLPDLWEANDMGVSVSEPVLVVRHNITEITTAFIWKQNRFQEKWWQYAQGLALLGEVSYWCPLPKGPKKNA